MRCSRAPTGAQSFEMDEMHGEPGCGPPGAPDTGTPAQARVRVRGAKRARLTDSVQLTSQGLASGV